MAWRKTDTSEGIFKFIVIIVAVGGWFLWAKTHSVFIAVAWVTAVVVSIGGFTFAFLQKRRHRLLESGIETVDKMSGQQFELFLKVHFENLGYGAETTAATGDYGADLVLSKDGKTSVVQAKRWKTAVGIEAIQQVVGAVRHYGASEAMVITTSRFTEAAKNLARTNEVVLWDREKLVEVMAQAAGKERAARIVTAAMPPDTLPASCPRCNGALIERSGSHGRFLGCSSFPKCRYTRNLENAEA